jgi:TIR domain
MATRIVHDLFISHASEDKEDIVYPLLASLFEEGVTSLWLDEISIEPSESIRMSVDKGIRESHYILVVLTQNYFKKYWTGLEFNAAFNLQRPFFPIWCDDVIANQVRKFSPMFADIKGIRYKKGSSQVAKDISEVIIKNKKTKYFKRIPERESQRVFWLGAELYIKYSLGIISIPKDVDEASQRVSNLTFVENYERDLKFTPDNVRSLASVLTPYCEDGSIDITEVSLIILDRLKQTSLEEGNWCPSTEGLDIIFKKLSNLT